MLLARGGSHCASMVPSRVCVSQHPRSHATWSMRGGSPPARTAVSTRTVTGIGANAITSAADNQHDGHEACRDAGDLQPAEPLVQDETREDDSAGRVERRE